MESKFGSKQQVLEALRRFTVEQWDAMGTAALASVFGSSQAKTAAVGSVYRWDLDADTDAAVRAVAAGCAAVTWYAVDYAVLAADAETVSNLIAPEHYQKLTAPFRFACRLAELAEPAREIVRALLPDWAGTLDELVDAAERVAYAKHGEGL